MRQQIFRLMVHSLSTQPQLTLADVEWGALSMTNILVKRDDVGKIIVIGLLSNRKTVTGRYARLFNLTLRNIIEERSNVRMERLLSKDLFELFPELYNNDGLSDVQIEKVEETIERELQTLLTSYNNNPSHVAPYSLSKLPPIYRNGGTNSYDVAHKWVTMKKFAPQSPRLSDRVMILNPNTMKICEYSRSQLIRNLAAGYQIDPYTKRKFHPETLDMLYERFDIEIKLLQYNVFTD